MSADGVEIGRTPGGSRMRLRVHAAARRTGVEGAHGRALRVSVSAAPEKGRANEAVEQLLASALGLAASDVRVVAGHTSRDKTVEIADLPPDEVRRRLGL